MAAKKSSTEPNHNDSGEQNVQTTEVEDTRPKRSGSEKGRAWPVIRTYYDPTTNCVMDILEVTKTLPGKHGQPPTDVVLEMTVHCRDEALVSQYTAVKQQVTIPNAEVN